jgi:hypothetical protein
MDQVKRTPKRVFQILVGLLATVAFGQESAKSILVLRPAGASFDDAKKGIKETLGSGYDLKEFVMTKESTADEVVKSWKAAAPKAVVAMDNKGVALFREARTKVGDSTTPVVALMGVRIDAALRGASSSAGINYEIPAVTILVNLRSILPTPLKKAGVVYRASMDDMFQRNAEFCKQENIELVGIKVDDAADAKSGLEKALKDIAGRTDIDALWVVNDNFFLNAKLIKEVWLPGLSGWKHPVIVGVETLVKPEYKFGTFAVLPDNYALGAQAAGLLQEIEDAGWKVEEVKVDQPLSVIKTLNLRGMKSCCGIQEGKLGEVDKVLE